MEAAGAHGASARGATRTKAASDGFDNKRRAPMLGTEQGLLSSRLPGYYELPISERIRIAGAFGGLSEPEMQDLSGRSGLSPELVDIFVENGIGTLGLPLGIATNFRINGKDVLVPMAVEETSVIAAASHGAKLARAGGGFSASADEPVMTGQIQLMLEAGVEYETILRQHRDDMIAYANRGQERLLSRGGGARDLTWRFIPEISCLVLHLHVHVGDAMGANIVNTMCEKLSVLMPSLFPCEIGLRILTNLTDQRRVRVSCLVPPSSLDSPEYSGAAVVDRIVMAYQFAAHDVYRAATNNKGIMNGIDPVVIATGNDWRAVEAGCHAWAAMSGCYKPLAVWDKTADGNLRGSMDIPMAVGVVGGVTKLHPGARAALRLLGSPDAQQLACIIAAVGLAQNLSALRALASEGIQKGHMHLHKGNIDLLTRQGATRA